ncbi:MAG: hypothetical protein GX417_09710 [Clostridiales bacterium]|nr:hypothetical protein [Clostridiales bacterium]
MMNVLNKNLDLLGAVTAVLFFVSAILVFSFRLAGKPQVGFWIGIFELCLAAPLIYLLAKAPALHRSTIYYIQICCMLLWLIVELLLDYLLKFDFRQVRWMVVSYVVLFFAGSGGLLGIATQAGRGWSIASIALFLIMAVLTFVQRAVTGM